MRLVIFEPQPMPQRDYSQLVAGQPGKLVVNYREWSGDPGGPSNSVVSSFDVAKGGQLQKIVDQISAVDITADGKKLLYRKGRDFFLV